jgi:phosphatidylethanolamine/phosphatidyl-N-methylethanolamine N-methyltransferase
MRRLAPAHGESVLEIGVGTGLSAVAYPESCRVVGIDISPAMLARARTRLRRCGAGHVSLCLMDAERLAFADARFDAVYAPYVLNVIPDPVLVAREMARVCRPDGRIVMLNHFARTDGAGSPVDAFLGKLAARFDINWHINLDAVLIAAGLTRQSVEQVNLPRVSSVVVCKP